MKRIPSVGMWTRYLFVVALVLPTVARTQIGAGTSDAKACAKAAKIVAKGHPAKKELAAFRTLSICGTTAVDALISGLSTYTYETDPFVIGDFMRHVDTWRDARIFDAVTKLATNEVASPAATPALLWAK